MTVEVKLLNYTFRFRKLTWREELALKIPPKVQGFRLVLAHALVDVSGLPCSTPEEAMKIFGPMPTPVAARVFRIYKGSLPEHRRFETANLYRAPEPSNYIRRVEEDESEEDKMADAAAAQLQARFGKEELKEAAEIDRQILAGSKLRGAVKK